MIKVDFQLTKGKYVYYRSVQVSAKTLSILVGAAGLNSGHVFRELEFKSPELAKRAAKKWIQVARDFGFSETDLKDAHLGTIVTTEGSHGPARVRPDGPLKEDIYISNRVAHELELEQGQRLACFDVRKNPKLKVEFMFGSQLGAGRITEPSDFKWTQNKKKPELAEKDQKQLAKLYTSLHKPKTELNGKLGKLKTGDLILTYEKGIYRFIDFEPDLPVPMVWFEPVFSGVFKRRLDLATSCAASFCAPLPKELADKLATAMNKIELC